VKVEATALEGVTIVEPVLYSDARGSFMETWNAARFGEVGLPTEFVQDNQSYSHPGVLRGMHYQTVMPQGKLVRAVVGEIFDVAVDLRRDSPTLGKWVGVSLSAENRRQLWIPPGFAHGFYVVRGPAEVLYKVTQRYSPQHERTLRWDDPDVGIEWPIPPGETPTVSGKDGIGDEFAAVSLYVHAPRV
jgi:dTDP-4-dehydrorhamnose 3,5-epimerase